MPVLGQPSRVLFKTPAQVQVGSSDCPQTRKNQWFPSGNNARTQAFTFHTKLLLEASGQPATPRFSEHQASQIGSSWMPGQANQGGPSVTTQRGGFCLSCLDTPLSLLLLTPVPTCLLSIPPPKGFYSLNLPTGFSPPVLLTWGCQKPTGTWNGLATWSL